MPRMQLHAGHFFALAEAGRIYYNKINQFKIQEDHPMEGCSNTRECPCTYPCPRHGKCCDCVAHHRAHNEGVPACFFSPEAEATYDRSVENLARDRGLIP